jgi:pimeloyl-ACP methyl ester carboxylesterase
MTSSEFHSHPASLQDYETAIEKIQAMQAGELATPGFNPELQTTLLTHGEKARRVVLWLHGYTAAPPQFKSLAELCFQRGYNVLVPRIPHHGFKDRLCSEVSKIKATELVRFTDEMIDLAHGLGEEVILGGLSMGGVMTCWAAQERADVSQAIIIAPFLGARIIPTTLTRLVAYGVELLPDSNQWWDPENKEKCDGPDYGYPWYSRHSLGQILKLGFKVFALGRRKPPAAARIFVVINDHDESVNNTMIVRLVETWKKSKARALQAFHFPDELGLPHDCISIEQPKGNTRLVYAELMRMMG